MSVCGEFSVLHVNFGRLRSPLLLRISSNWLDMDAVLYAFQIYLLEPKVWDGKTLSCTVPFVLEVVWMEWIVRRVVVRAGHC